MTNSESCIIFGAYGGIGKEISQRLTGKGYGVLLCGRSEEKLKELSSTLDQPYFIADVTDASSVNAAFQKGKEQFGELTGAVNTVGSVFLKPAHLTSAEEFSRVIKVNLESAFNVVRAATATLKTPGGSIVLISSAAAKIGLKNHEAISAAKAGIEGLVLSAAATYASKGLRVNAVAPGLVETGLTSAISKNEASRQYSLSLHPIGRLGKAVDIASCIDWLLSSEQSWISGQIIGVDGGLSTMKVKA